MHNESLRKKSVALEPRRAKTYWSGWCQMAVQGALRLAKRLSLNLNFSFLNRISLLLIQVTTQLSSRGWVNPVPDPIPPEKFLGYSRESNPGPLGWQSDVLTTIPNRHSNRWGNSAYFGNFIISRTFIFSSLKVNVRCTTLERGKERRENTDQRKELRTYFQTNTYFDILSPSTIPFYCDTAYLIEYKHNLSLKSSVFPFIQILSCDWLVAMGEWNRRQCDVAWNIQM